MSSDLRDYSTRMIGLLLIAEAVVAYFLWTLNPTDQAGETVFGLFLAVDLVSLSMMSYIYRTYKRGDGPHRGPLLVACCMILILVYASLAI
ncbi:MAG: hypothetical protein JRN20_04625 [Nitrososphaerota archaeon]|nr:hypothetical protein [Nitrososphaerota archaeon]